MSKKIRIEAEGADMLSIDEIEDFQGDLKSMDDATLGRFAAQIERNDSPNRSAFGKLRRAVTLFLMVTRE